LEHKLDKCQKSGYFCATDVTKLCNEARLIAGRNEKEMDKYFNN